MCAGDLVDSGLVGARGVHTAHVCYTLCASISATKRAKEFARVQWWGP